MKETGVGGESVWSSMCLIAKSPSSFFVLKQKQKEPRPMALCGGDDLRETGKV